MWIDIGCCQSNANPSPEIAGLQEPGNDKVAPLAQGGVTFQFESGSSVYVPFEVEVIVH